MCALPVHLTTQLHRRHNRIVESSSRADLVCTMTLVSRHTGNKINRFALDINNRVHCRTESVGADDIVSAAVDTGRTGHKWCTDMVSVRRQHINGVGNKHVNSKSWEMFDVFHTEC